MLQHTKDGHADTVGEVMHQGNAQYMGKHAASNKMGQFRKLSLQEQKKPCGS